MELHSYAKRRTSKKWTLEQKRKLVEARIAHDAWFTNKPSSLVPWKNILIAANLDDFNVFFVRKQWSNMLERYKQYRQTRLGNIATKAIDAEQIKRINQEWEFFESIHKFMTRKTTNLHSYALTHRTNNDNTNNDHQETEEKLLQNSTTSVTGEGDGQIDKTITKLHNETIKIKFPEDCAKENIPNNTTIVIHTNNISQDDGIHLFSSDTNEEFQLAAGSTRLINNGSHREEADEEKEEEEDENMSCVRNTDHDFYSKRSCLGDMATNVGKRHGEDEDLQEQQSNYFADASEESQEGSMNMVVDLVQSHHHHNAQATNSVPLKNVVTVRDINAQTFEIKSENITQTEIIDLKEERQEDPEFLNDMPSISTHSNLSHNINVTHTMPTTTTTATRLSERDKYYRHKRRFNRRLEQRFDAVLQVMGQIIKVQYPTVDVTPLMGFVNSMASSMGKIFSSDSEDVNQQSDESDNIPTTTNENQ